VPKPGSGGCCEPVTEPSVYLPVVEKALRVLPGRHTGAGLKFRVPSPALCLQIRGSSWYQAEKRHKHASRLGRGRVKRQIESRQAQEMELTGCLVEDKHIDMGNNMRLWVE
jgi:hypothetical protein